MSEQEMHVIGYFMHLLILLFRRGSNWNVEPIQLEATSELNYIYRIKFARVLESGLSCYRLLCINFTYHKVLIFVKFMHENKNFMIRKCPSWRNAVLVFTPMHLVWCGVHYRIPMLRAMNA